MYSKTWIPVLLLLFALPANAQTYVFAQLQGAPVNTAGWNLSGSAVVTNVTGTGYSEVRLTPAVNGTSGAIFFDQPISLSMCKKWKAEFDYRLYDGTAADGIAFCFLDVPPTGFVLGDGLGIPKSANGLKICIDTWDNCTPNTPSFQMPKVEVRWGVGYNLYDQAGNIVTEGECRTDNGPTVANVNGQLSVLRSNQYQHVIIEYDDGNLSVNVAGFQLVNNVPTPQFNFAGYLGFTGSTGGSNDNQSIKNVIIYTEMPPSVAGLSSHPVCPGDTVHLGTGDNPNYTFNWSPAVGLSSTTMSNPIATLVNTTGNVLNQTYYVKTAFKANPGCQSEDSVTVQINPSPLVDFAVPVICLPKGNTTINNKTVISDGTQSQITYKWSFSDGGASAQINPTHNYTTAGNYSVKLKAVSSSGCADSATKNITINPQAKASITSPAEFCQDSTFGFSGSSGGNTAQTWQWSFGDNTIDSVQNPQHTYSAAKTYQAKMYFTTMEGCPSDTAVASVTINPLPVASMYFSGLACEGQTFTFNENANPSIGTITSRKWLFDDGATATTQAATHVFTPYGSHTVSLAVQNSKGCNSKPYAKTTIVIQPLPSVDFSTPAICRGINGAFSDKSTIADGTGGQFSYKWYFGDGGSGTGPTPSHSYASAGNYSVKLVVTSGNNCVDSATKTFPVSDYPVVDFQVLTTDFCGNLPLQLKDNSSVQYGTLDTLKFFWDASTSVSEDINNPVKGTVYTHNYPTFGYTNSLQVTLKIQAFSSGHCYSEKSGVSVLFASPKLVFGPVPVYCENNAQSIPLTQARDTTVFQGAGYYSGDGVANNNFSPAIAGAGYHVITYHYTLSNGCSDTVTQSVKVGVKPAVSAGPEGVILRGGQIVLQGAASGGDNLSYNWQPPTSLSDNTILQPLATPVNDIYYTLKATNSDGCFDTAGVLVKVLQFPTVPNAFSPNGDGINDSWQIQYISSYPDAKINVFNRYGQLVFASTGYSRPWDGTLNGRPLPIGTYYYIIATTHLPKPISGNVTIIR